MHQAERQPASWSRTRPVKVVLFGSGAPKIAPIIERHGSFDLVEENPEVVICYGGDGTLLSAEHAWPGVPKAPIRNSRRGNRTIALPVEEVIDRLAEGRLEPIEFIKLGCEIHKAGSEDVIACPGAMNEFNVHMARINSAVRWRMWVNEEPVEHGEEIIGDGFVVSTPFGSTAYFRQITRGVFYTGLGIAFKLTTDQVNHLIVPESAVMTALITRGPALLALDNRPEYFDLGEGDRLIIKKHPECTTILTAHHMSHPSDEF